MPPIDFVKGVNELKKFQYSFVLSPSLWKRFEPPISLEWKKVKFTNDSSSLPKEKGVYAFIIQFENNSFPNHGYVMYIGETSRTLVKRYKEYLTESKIRKRPKIFYLLNNWKDVLYFHYAAVSTNDVDLKQIEKSLNDAFIPPCSENDFSTDVKQILNAF